MTGLSPTGKYLKTVAELHQHTSQDEPAHSYPHTPENQPYIEKNI